MKNFNIHQITLVNLEMNNFCSCKDILIEERLNYPSSIIKSKTIDISSDIWINILSYLDDFLTVSITSKSICEICKYLAREKCKYLLNPNFTFIPDHYYFKVYHLLIYHDINEISKIFNILKFYNQNYISKSSYIYYWNIIYIFLELSSINIEFGISETTFNNRNPTLNYKYSTKNNSDNLKLIKTIKWLKLFPKSIIFIYLSSNSSGSSDSEDEE